MPIYEPPMKYDKVDNKIAKYGFRKTEEDYYGVRYERYDEEFGFNQVLTILHKKSGKHEIHSYDARTIYDFETHDYFCSGCGFEAELLRLLKKKFKIMKRRYKW